MPFNTQAPWNIVIVNNVTGSRAFGVTYTNNSGKTMFVMITVIQQAPALMDSAVATAFVGGFTVGNIGVQSLAAGTQILENHILVFTVPPGTTYEVTSSITGTGSNTLTDWIESN